MPCMEEASGHGKLSCLLPQDLQAPWYWAPSTSDTDRKGEASHSVMDLSAYSPKHGS